MDITPWEEIKTRPQPTSRTLQPLLTAVRSQRTERHRLQFNLCRATQNARATTWPNPEKRVVVAVLIMTKASGRRRRFKGNRQKTAPSNSARECILMADGDLSGKAEATLQHEAGPNTGQQQAGRVQQFSQFTGFGLNWFAPNEPILICSSPGSNGARSKANRFSQFN
jgi:hypothetical protein